MSGTNQGPMRLMQHWSEKDTPSIMSGHQTHWPVGGSGYAMSKKGMKAWSCDSDGIRRKVRGSAIMAIKARNAKRKATYRKGGQKAKQ